MRGCCAFKKRIFFIFLVACSIPRLFLLKRFFGHVRHVLSSKCKWMKCLNIEGSKSQICFHCDEMIKRFLNEFVFAGDHLILHVSDCSWKTTWCHCDVFMFFDWFCSKFLIRVKELILMGNESCIVCYLLVFVTGFVWFIGLQFEFQFGFCSELDELVMRVPAIFWDMWRWLITYLTICAREIFACFVFEHCCVTKWMKKKKIASA